MLCRASLWACAYLIFTALHVSLAASPFQSRRAETILGAPVVPLLARSRNRSLVEASSTRLLVCDYDWTSAPQFHMARDQWGFVGEGAFGTLMSGSCPSRPGSEQDKVATLGRLLGQVAPMLNGLEVNWFLVYGSLIGQMRSESIIPWDGDVDVMVPTGHRLKLFEHIEQQPGAREIRNGQEVTVSATQQIEEGRSMMMLAHKSGEIVQKVLWVDPATCVAIDGCFDCGYPSPQEVVPTRKAMLSNVEVNVPALPGRGLDFPELQHDPDGQLISMVTHRDSWACKEYQCSSTSSAATRPQEGLSALARHTAAFVLDSAGVGQCATAFPAASDCNEVASAIPESIDVKPCTLEAWPRL